MASASNPIPDPASADHGLLAKSRTIVGPGFNRWLMPPAALAMHLCIGMAYGFSVFWLPLSKAIGIKESLACPKTMGLLGELFAKDCDWHISSLTVMYTVFFIFLGLAAAIWGGWLERVGPRKAGVVAALCWCGGLVISSIGVSAHQLWLMWLGSGVIGGIGLGLGYISPVSMLIKWFPDRRGMATGMAIMGFGGGAMIGSPLADELMKKFATDANVGVTPTFLVMAAVYFIYMLGGAFGYRLPAPGWKPAGWTAPVAAGGSVAGGERHVHVSKVWGIPQFWLVWMVLTMNVSAGIGVLGMASPMLQEVFGGQLIHQAIRFVALDKGGLAAIASVAAGFTALLSLFNIIGRFFWASLSDKIRSQRSPTRCSSCSAVRCTRACRWRRGGPATSRRLSRRSASSSACMAAGFRRCRPTSPTCSARRWSVRSMVGS